jgi:DNA-binding XRE family transcriptional regulator
MSKNDLPLGHDLKKVRERAGLTQAELAVRIGVSQQTIWNWENNCYTPDQKKQKKLNIVLTELGVLNNCSNQ